MAKNRSELVAEVAEKAGTTQAAVNGVLDAMFQVFESSVSNGNFSLGRNGCVGALSTENAN